MVRCAPFCSPGGKQTLPLARPSVTRPGHRPWRPGGVHAAGCGAPGASMLTQLFFLGKEDGQARYKELQNTRVLVSEPEWTLATPAPHVADGETEVQTGKVTYTKHRTAVQMLLVARNRNLHPGGLHKRRLYWSVMPNSLVVCPLQRRRGPGAHWFALCLSLGLLWYPKRS